MNYVRPLETVIKLRPVWYIYKHKAGQRNPDNLMENVQSVFRFDNNSLLYEGAETIAKLIGGIGSETVYSNANARIGVGNGTGAVVATQTDLQGASKTYVAMDATYPQNTGTNNEKLEFQALFGDGIAEYAWEEFTVDNGAAAAKNINRKLQSAGTKVSGNEWTVKVIFTLS